MSSREPFSYGGVDRSAAQGEPRPAFWPVPRILVVEDDLLILQLNALALRRAGYQVDTADGGQAGWNQLRLQAYDLLITDHEMADLSGLDLARQARAARLTLPILFVSGSLDGEQLRRGESLQPVALLPKPFALSQLVEAVARMLPGLASQRSALMGCFPPLDSAGWDRINDAASGPASPSPFNHCDLPSAALRNKKNA